MANQVLLRLAKDGAWATPTLDAELKRADLDPRDAGLATEIVYGALRVLPELDRRINAHVARPNKTQPLALSAMRVAAYQILHLSRVPVHAAVDEAVRWVRTQQGPRVGGFVNAVLRKLATERPENPEPPQELITPRWLQKRIRGSIGDAAFHQFRSLREMPPPLGIRIVDGTDAEAFADEIRECIPGVEVRSSPWSPQSLLVRGGSDPRRWPGFSEGRFVVQEQGSQLVGMSAGALKGERILDACAGRGGKTLQLLASVGPEGSVVATDIHQHKLDEMGMSLARVGIGTDRLIREAVDLSVGDGGLQAGFDRILVDAPCTGTGTLHRRPDLMLRLGPRDPQRMASLQLELLRRCATLLRAGGQLIYAVCSPLRQEGPDVFEAFLAEHEGMTSRPTALPSANLERSPDGSLRLGPWLGELDAYQVFTAQAV